MSFTSKRDQLHLEIIAKLSEITEYPNEFLPHTVYVEDESRDEHPLYHRYKLTAIQNEGLCTLLDPATRISEERCMSEINMDWLICLWNHYQNLCADQKIQPVPEQSEKELWAFVFPDSRLQRDAPNEKILSAWKNGPAHSADKEILSAWTNGPACSADKEEDEEYEVKKLTPDEFAAYCNDGFFNESNQYVRFIET